MKGLLQKGYFVVDCTHMIKEGCPQWPGINPPFCRQYTSRADPEKTAPSKEYFTMGCDSGTHVDAPAHFYPGAKSISDIAEAELIGPAVVIDVVSKVNSNLLYELTVEDIQEWELRHGRIPDGAVVCMRTGWSQRFNDEKLYQNKQGEEWWTQHFPGVSPAAAEFLVKQRSGFSGLGIDTLSLDVGTTKTFPVHYIVLGAGKYMVENMVLTGLPESGAVMVVAPIKVKDAPECPARVLALLPSTTCNQS